MGEMGSREKKKKADLNDIMGRMGAWHMGGKNGVREKKHLLEKRLRRGERVRRASVRLGEADHLEKGKKRRIGGWGEG